MLFAIDKRVRNSLIIVCISLLIFLFVSELADARQVIETTATPTPNPAPTPVDFLPETLLEKTQDASCIFPCWFGWNLGEDNVSDVLEKIELLSYESPPYSVATYSDYVYIAAGFRVIGIGEAPDLEDVYLAFLFFIDNDTDRLVAVQTEINVKASFSSTDWDLYLPYNLAKTYNAPSYINFQIRTRSNETSWYAFTTQYDTPDLTIQYRGELGNIADKDEITVCPSQSATNIIAWIEVEDVPIQTILRDMLEDEDLLVQGRLDITDTNFGDLFSEENRCFNVST